jgi:tRNA A-37 threonylcarbamoyl transferase component Bud32
MESTEVHKKERDPESVAEQKLEEILRDPRYQFLHQRPQNQERIDNASTAVEALAIAHELIARRLEGMLEFRSARAVEGLRMGTIDKLALRNRVEEIKQNQELIGEGGDAFVVIDKNEEFEELPPEICYKIAKKKKNQEGGNTIFGEVEVHDDFFRVAQLAPETSVRVPKPYYCFSTGEHDLIGMERLPASSLRDIRAGKGKIPEWLDEEKVCTDLGELLALLHREGLYHRDLHEGNIMIRQGDEAPQDGVCCYMIDFGHSARVMVGEEPYAKQEGSKVFTYKADDGIVAILREFIRYYRQQ